MKRASLRKELKRFKEKEKKKKKLFFRCLSSSFAAILTVDFQHL
jgi:hypothetical protein